MTTITASSTTGVVLTSPSYANPVVINPGVTISSAGYGVFANTGSWTIQNAGSIAGGTAPGAGIKLEAGGSVTNQSVATISGNIGIYGVDAALAVVNYGSIAGNITSGAGVDLFAGVVTNQSTGSISGYTGILGVGAVTVVNNGSIAGNTTSSHGDGIKLEAGGSVTNQSGAAISGYGGISAFNPAITVVNAGNIAGNATASSGAGVDLFAGGYVTNTASASITGYHGIGISSDAGTVVNAGSIAGDMTFGEGVFLEAGGSVTNQSAGTISGYTGIGGNGILAVTVVNAGSITGNPASGKGEGVDLNWGGSVTNQSTGMISGAVGVYATNGAITVANYGSIAGTGASGIGVDLQFAGSVTNAASASIAGTTSGAYLSAGGTLTNAGTIVGNTGTAVAFGGTGSKLLVLDPGSGFSGVVTGGTNASNTLELASGASAGTLSGLSNQYIDFAQTTIDAGASWSLTGASTLAAGSTLTELSGASFTDTGALENDGAIVLDPSTMTVAGLTGTGSVTIDAGSTLEVQGTIASSETIGFAGNGAYLHLDTPGGMAGSVTNFAVGETIDLKGVDSVNYQGGTLSFSEDSVSVGSFALSLASAGTVTASASGDGVDVTVLCFCANTRILTPSGERPVQALAAGDLVTTWRGEARRIAWIGIGKVLATRGRRNAATPVIVRKGALADNVPHHDLRVTKGHAFYLDGALIPVEFLVNHCSILWDDHAQEVELYHIELSSHDVLVANGAPAESYRDDGNRWLFQNANSGWPLPPQEPCAPVLTGGAVVDAVWRRLLERAGPRRTPPLTQDADLHLLVDGKRLDLTERVGKAYICRLPAVPSVLRIVSRAAIPAEFGLARDPRVLGVAVRRLVVRKGRQFRATEANDDRLTDGFHAFEADNGFRWTDGDAAIPSALFAGFTGPLDLILYIGGTARYLANSPVQRAA